MSQSDAQLVKRTLRGERAAFATLVGKYQDLVHGLAFHKLHDLCLAEEVAQEAFVLAYVRLSQLRDQERFAGWLRAVTLNAVKMKLRDAGRSGLSLDAHFADADDDGPLPGRRLRTELVKHGPPTPHEDLERKEFREVVMRAIDDATLYVSAGVLLYAFDVEKLDRAGTEGNGVFGEH